jgi:hypothetical protein
VTTVSLDTIKVPDPGTTVAAVSTRYLISRRSNGALCPLKIGREPATGAALPVFGSLEGARCYLRSRKLGPGWQVRISSSGELASILSGLCRGVEAVVLDQSPAGLAGGPASEMTRRRFLDLLVGDGSVPEPSPVLTP